MDTKLKQDIKEIFYYNHNIYKSYVRRIKLKASKRGKVKVYSKEEIFLYKMKNCRQITTQ